MWHWIWSHGTLHSIQYWHNELLICETIHDCFILMLDVSVYVQFPIVNGGHCMEAWNAHILKHTTIAPPLLQVNHILIFNKIQLKHIKVNRGDKKFLLPFFIFVTSTCVYGVRKEFHSSTALCRLLYHVVILCRVYSTSVLMVVPLHPIKTLLQDSETLVVVWSYFFVGKCSFDNFLGGLSPIHVSMPWLCATIIATAMSYS